MGGYYIARFEASGTTKIISKYDQIVLPYKTQSNAAKLAREMYGDTTDYASDLVNSYAWDTAIIFIQTYSTGEDASNYASKNKGPTNGKQNTGTSTDKYCNIWDMSGNVLEYTTEYSSYNDDGYTGPLVYCGGGEIEGTTTNTGYSSLRHHSIPRYNVVMGKFRLSTFTLCKITN